MRRQIVAYGITLAAATASAGITQAQAPCAPSSPCARTPNTAAPAVAPAPVAAVAPAPVAPAPVAAGTHAAAPAPVAAPAHAHAGVNPQSDRLERDLLFQRGLNMAVIGAGGAYAAEKVSGVARGVANFGKVGDVPVYNHFAASVPIFGGAAVKGSLVPTTLGQVPVMGPLVSKVPVVGPVVAGPANPILVGAVAVDNYLIPKYSPCGYTKSSVIAATNDFNSPPKLRHYVNYLAPLPYTHPPIYAPSTLKTDIPAQTAYIDGVSDVQLNQTISVPN